MYRGLGLKGAGTAEGKNKREVGANVGFCRNLSELM